MVDFCVDESKMSLLLEFSFVDLVLVLCKVFCSYIHVMKLQIYFRLLF